MKKSTDYTSLTDEVLMGFYQDGEVMAFNVLYARFSKPVISYLRKKTRSEKLAQDLTQEVFLKLHRSKNQYDQMLPFAPWIFSISRSVFLDAAKKRNFEDLMEPERFDQIAATNELIDGFDSDLLAALPDSQRQAISMRVYDEATFEMIAAKLATSPENARQLFSRGIKQLKAKMIGRSE